VIQQFPMPAKPIPQLTVKDKERFISKVDKRGPDECWLWTDNLNRSGEYGSIKIQGKEYRAHRVAFLLEHGCIPIQYHCLHTCDNPPCCNPKHLFLGTHLDNHQDKARKGRGILGERSRMSKLKEKQVLNIISRCKNGELQQDLATEYSVSISLISRILKGTRWPHLQNK